MKNTFVRVKGIIKKGDKYLLIKRWVDDHIPEPYVWEFIDAEVSHGDSPDDTVLQAIRRVSADRTVISISHRTGAQTGRVIPIEPAH